MTVRPRMPAAVAVVAALTVAAAPGVAGEKIVVHSRLDAIEGRTATYTSRDGKYTATWVGRRRYRLQGTIRGRRFTGTIRTRQARSGKRYRATGRGRLGRRSVRISGGGPNTLRTATLILRVQ